MDICYLPVRPVLAPPRPPTGNTGFRPVGKPPARSQEPRSEGGRPGDNIHDKLDRVIDRSIDRSMAPYWLARSLWGGEGEGEGWICGRLS